MQDALFCAIRVLEKNAKLNLREQINTANQPSSDVI